MLRLLILALADSMHGWTCLICSRNIIQCNSASQVKSYADSQIVSPEMTISVIKASLCRCLSAKALHAGRHSIQFTLDSYGVRLTIVVSRNRRFGL